MTLALASVGYGKLRYDMRLGCLRLYVYGIVSYKAWLKAKRIMSALPYFLCSSIT